MRVDSRRLDRVLKIAGFLDEGRELSHHREFRVWVGVKPKVPCRCYSHYGWLLSRLE